MPADFGIHDRGLLMALSIRPRSMKNGLTVATRLAYSILSGIWSHTP